MIKYNLDELIQLVYCKELNNSEKKYLDTLLTGLDNQVNTSNQWLNSDEGLTLFEDKPDDVKQYLQDSRLYSNLLKIINNNVDDSLDHIEDFYNTGKEVADKQLGYALGFLPSDKEALAILTNYNAGLITDINTELMTGILATIGAGVIGGVVLSEVNERVLELPKTPLDSPVSVETRVTSTAMTEYSRSVNTGTLQSYANAGGTQVEIVTAGDGLVCDECLDLEANNPYTLKEMPGLIPVHPNCRCGVYLLEGEDENPTDPIIIDLTPEE